MAQLDYIGNRIDEHGTRRYLTGDTLTNHLRQITAAYHDGMSIRAIAEATGRSYGSVHRELTRAGVQLRPRGGPKKK